MSVNARRCATERIARLAQSGLDVATFFREAGAAVGAVVQAREAPCWTTLDPASLLITSSLEEGWPQVPPELLAVEYLEDEPFTSARVARSPEGMLTLRQATGGDPARSRAYRDFMAPTGVGDVVEAALRTRSGQVWGTVGLVRDISDHDFGTDDLAFLRAVAPLLAQGVRHGLLVGDVADPESPGAPGMIILDNDWHVESLTPGVDQWLAELPGEWERRGTPPPSVVSVASQCVAQRSRRERTGRSRHRTRADPHRPVDRAARRRSRRGRSAAGGRNR